MWEGIRFLRFCCCCCCCCLLLDVYIYGVGERGLIINCANIWMCNYVMYGIGIVSMALVLNARVHR